VERFGDRRDCELLLSTTLLSSERMLSPPWRPPTHLLRYRHIMIGTASIPIVGAQTDQKTLPVWLNGWSWSIVHPLPVELQTMALAANGSGSRLRAQIRDHVAPTDCASTSSALSGDPIAQRMSGGAQESLENN